jgi:hypothetical protein
MLVHNHNPRLDKTQKMTPMIKAVRTPYRHSLLHHPHEMHNIKIQISNALRTGLGRRRDLNSMRWTQPASKHVLLETRRLHRLTSATTTAVVSSQGHVKMNENVYYTLTSISDIHSITNSVYFRRSFLFWPLLPTHYGCRALLLHLVITLTHIYTRYGSSGRSISPSQRPLPDITQHSHGEGTHNTGAIRTRILNKPAVADLCLRPRGHRDRPKRSLRSKK